MTPISETQACLPVPIENGQFNEQCVLPYGLTHFHLQDAMQDFIDFLGFINEQLQIKRIPRLECFLMPANFSSIVGEFMNMSIPKYCDTLVKNLYHNGHPHLIPSGQYPGDAIQHSHEGIEIKGSRRGSGWQGHNPEQVWLMVFHFDSNTSNDLIKGIAAKKFQFKGVYAAKLDLADWSFSGRSATSRRTITASVKKSGRDKMKENWVYKSSN